MRVKGLNTIAIVLFALLAFAIIALPVSAESGSIKGMLKDNETQQPLSGVVVLANDRYALTFTCQVQSDGVFSFADVFATTYILTANSDGFKSQSRAVKINPGQNPDIEVLMFSSSMAPGGIEGKVYDNYNNTAGGVTITVSNGSYTTNTLTSDNDGSYSIQGLSPDQYTVTAKMAGYKDQADTVSVPPGKTIEKNFIMTSESSSLGSTKKEKDYELQLVVYDRDTKELIKNATVTLTYKTAYKGDTYTFSKTYSPDPIRNDGIFRIGDINDPNDVLVDGEYYLTVSANGYVTYNTTQPLYKSYMIGSSVELVPINSPFSSDSPFISQPDTQSKAPVNSTNPVVRLWNWFTSRFK